MRERRPVGDRAALATARDAEELIAVTAHDMRTPLTAIIQALSILQGGRAGDLNDKQARFIDLSLDAARCLVDLTRGMQDAARVGRMRPPMRFERFGAEEPVRFAVDALSTHAEGRAVGLEVEAEPVACWGDAQLVRRVLLNLVSNALKFSPAGSRVRLVVKRAGAEAEGHVRYSVVDGGPGIPTADLERIFEKFFQSRQPTDVRREGTGLGLAITRDIVVAHGGTISVTNNPERGCRFDVSLPAFGSGVGARCQVEDRLARDPSGVALLGVLAAGWPAGRLLETLERVRPKDGEEVVDLGMGALGLLVSTGEACDTSVLSPLEETVHRAIEVPVWTVRASLADGCGDPSSLVADLLARLMASLDQVEAEQTRPAAG